MMEFIAANAATIIGSVIVFGILFLIIFKKVRDHKNHKGGCGCGCGHCPNSGACHPK